MARKRESGTEQFATERVKAVLRILQNDGPLSAKQKSYCSEACVERFLKSRGNNVKKTAKQLRACLAWRDGIPIEHLIADEFSAEIAEGIAYVAGRDEDARPVMIVRMKQDYQKFQSQKLYVRLLVFTLEVAIASMLPGVEQCILIFDAGYLRSGSTCLSLILATLKMSADYYPGRLAKAFVVDPPSVFNYLWKGIRPFIDSAINLNTVSSRDYDTPFLRNEFARASSLRHDLRSPNVGSSFRFSRKVVSENARLSLGGLEADGHAAHSVGPALISPLNARSFSFASPATTRFRSPAEFRGFKNELGTPSRNNTTPHRSASTPLRSYNKYSILSSSVEGIASLFHGMKKEQQQHPLEGIASLFHGMKKEQQQHPRPESNGKEKNTACFQTYLKFYRSPYDEIAYRSMMRPPLGGLASIVSPELKRLPTPEVRRTLYL